MGSSSVLSTMSMWVITTAVVVLGIATLFGEADTPSCASDLVPCSDYLTTTAPPSATCCTAIKDTTATQLACLCNLFYTPGLLESLGANTSSALRIANACGQPLNTGSCKAFLADSPNNAPATPAGPAPDKGGSSRVGWTGFSALLLFWIAFVMFN